MKVCWKLIFKQNVYNYSGISHEDLYICTIIIQTQVLGDIIKSKSGILSKLLVADNQIKRRL